MVTPLGSFDLSLEAHHQLDVKDRKILFSLLRNARMSFTDIAKKVGLSKESVQYRFKQLLAHHIILRTYAEVDFEKLGFEVFQIVLLLDERKQKEQEQLRAALLKDPNVLRVVEFSDNWDIEITVLARNIRDFNELSERLLDPFEDIIMQKNTSGVIMSMHNDAFPDVTGLDVRDDEFTEKQGEEISYDANDLKILQELCSDARTSTYDIAKKIKLSPDAIGLRIKKLIKCAIIKRFTCMLNFSALSYQGFVFCFGAACMTKKDDAQFFYFAEKSPHVITVMKSLGDWDLKTYLVVKDPATLHKIIREIRSQFSTSVRNYETWVIYKEHLFNPFPKVLL